MPIAYRLHERHLQTEPSMRSLLHPCYFQRYLRRQPRKGVGVQLLRPRCVRSTHHSKRPEARFRLPMSAVFLANQKGRLHHRIPQRGHRAKKRLNACIVGKNRQMRILFLLWQPSSMDRQQPIFNIPQGFRPHGIAKG